MIALDACRSECDYLIYPSRCECDQAKYCELCRFIERLGGVKSAGGYAFPTSLDRSIAAELLGDKFGTRYFELS